MGHVWIWYWRNAGIQVSSLRSQLECWNSGIMGSGIMKCWNNGPAIGGIDDKIKMVNILLKTNIPSFHHSIIPFPGQIRKPQKTSIFSVGCRNSDTLSAALGTYPDEFKSMPDDLKIGGAL